MKPYPLDSYDVICCAVQIISHVLDASPDLKDREDLTNLIGAVSVVLNIKYPDAHTRTNRN